MVNSLANALVQAIHNEYQFSIKQIEAVLKLLEDKNTVPFIARYRKEMTDGLDEVEIKKIADEFNYLQNLQKRKDEVIHSIEQQGLLTETLKQDILKQTKLQRVEDLYRPYKQKKKTRATEAKRKGLAPLAKWIDAQNETESIDIRAKQFINEEVPTIEAAILGAQDIIAERIADHPQYRQRILNETQRHGVITATKKKNAVDENEIFAMYYNYSEPLKRLANHRILAMNRGEKEKILAIKIDVDQSLIIDHIKHSEIMGDNPLSHIVKNAIEDAMKRLIFPSIEREIRTDLTKRAEDSAIEVFSKNLKQLLLQPPLKQKQILGIDPAYRTGCKLAVINSMGSFVAKSVMYPHPPVSKMKDAERIFLNIINTYDIDLIAIGNGTASRETEQFVANMIQTHGLKVQYIIVNEAGASVYSASDIARQEFPDFQVEERSAASIGRRVQDPLSELVKIDPKSIGVGQYQHDVNQKQLGEALDLLLKRL